MAIESKRELEIHGGLAYWLLCEGSVGVWDRGDGNAEIHYLTDALKPIQFVMGLTGPRFQGVCDFWAQGARWKLKRSKIWKQPCSSRPRTESRPREQTAFAHSGVYQLTNGKIHEYAHYHRDQPRCNQRAVGR